MMLLCCQTDFGRQLSCVIFSEAAFKLTRSEEVDETVSEIQFSRANR